MGKEVFILFSEYPFGTDRFSEKLRMAVGLTLIDENSLNLVFLKNSRNALGELDETAIDMNPISKHIKMLSELGAKFFVEKGEDCNYLDGLKPDSFETNGLEPLIEMADLVIT